MNLLNKNDGNMRVQERINIDIERMFLRADTDKNGLISETEFYYAINASLNRKIPLSDAKQLAKLIDIDKDGYINIQEFKLFMNDQLRTDILSSLDCSLDMQYYLTLYDIDNKKEMEPTELE